MTKQEFLTKNLDSPYYKNIEAVLNFISSYSFIKVEFTEEELPKIETVGVYDGPNPTNSEFGLTLIKMLMRNLYSDKEVETITGLTDVQLFDKFLSMLPEEESNMVTSGLIVMLIKQSFGFMNITPEPNTKRKDDFPFFYPVGKIKNTTIYVDPYQRYNDYRSVVVSDKTIMVKINSLFSDIVTLPPGSRFSAKHGIEIIVNPDTVKAYQMVESEIQALV